MSFLYGFYNAKVDKNGSPDRSYDAEDFSKYLDGIVSDGVIRPYGDAFKVSVVDSAERVISVGTGKGWFNGTWSILDSPKKLYLASNPVNHLDAVILKIDKSARENSIYVKSFGNQITLINDINNGIFEYCLAGIRVTDNAIVRVNSHIGEGDPTTPWSVCLLAGGKTSSGGGGGSVSVNDSGAYTTGITFVKDGFNLEFTNATGLKYINEFLVAEHEGKVRWIRNKTLGRGITVDYDE